MTDDEHPTAKDMAVVEALLQRLLEDPESPDLREDLLIAYCHPFFADAPERIETILWMVAHRPTAPLLRSPCGRVDRDRLPERYAEVEHAWEACLQVRAGNSAVIRGAVWFLFDAQPERAVQLLRDALAARPGDAELWMDLAGSREDPAEKLAMLERARDLGAKQPNLLRWMCDAALDAEDLAKAAQYGAELLAGSYGKVRRGANPRVAHDARGLVPELLRPRGQRAYARHHGHATLGLVALRRGDTQGAREHLRASVEVDTDARLSSYGPSFALAEALAQLGFFEDVVAYLMGCQAFWKDPILEEWCEELRAGRVPAFD